MMSPLKTKVARVVGYGNNLYAQALQVHDDAYFSTSGFTPPTPLH